jgi:hypothetical protein
MDDFLSTGWRGRGAANGDVMGAQDAGLRPGKSRSRKAERPTPRVRVPKLNNLAGVIAELGALYRAARRGEVEAQDAARLASILSIARSCLELQHKLSGELKDAPLVSVSIVGEIQVTVLRALEPYPKARQAVAQALEELAGHA